MSLPQNPPILVQCYQQFLRIRLIELAIEAVYHLDEMKTPIHLSIGQEAVAVGVCAHLQTSDLIFSNHRSHAHYLAKGGNLNAMFAELYGRQTGCSGGRGGSMHLIDTSVGHYGSSAIVAGSIPHAVGAALAFKMQKQNLMTVAFFGDAATEEGVFFESMNLAMLKEVPMLFVCENNRYSVCSPIESRQANDYIAMRAKAFNMPAERVDGMDLVKTFWAAQEAVEYVRRERRPMLLEFTVERWRAHAGAGDPQRKEYRRLEDIRASEAEDPLKAFEFWLLDEQLITEELIEKMRQEIEAEIEVAFNFAKHSPHPNKEDVGKNVFCE